MKPITVRQWRLLIEVYESISLESISVQGILNFAASIVNSTIPVHLNSAQKGVAYDVYLSGDSL